MSLFQCDKCGGRENTACVSYWGQDRELCSECRDGKWHDKFPQLLLPKGQFKTNGVGNLEHIETGCTDLAKHKITKT